MIPILLPGVLNVRADGRDEGGVVGPTAGLHSYQATNTSGQSTRSILHCKICSNKQAELGARHFFRVTALSGGTVTTHLVLPIPHFPLYS